MTSVCAGSGPYRQFEDCHCSICFALTAQMRRMKIYLSLPSGVGFMIDRRLRISNSDPAAWAIRVLEEVSPDIFGRWRVPMVYQLRGEFDDHVRHAYRSCE
jgi:hypothetical protein